MFVRQAIEAKKWAFATDYIRLKVVYEYGGIYMDTDVELIKPLDSLLDNKLYFGLQYSNSFIYSVPILYLSKMYSAFILPFLSGIPSFTPIPPDSSPPIKILCLNIKFVI